MKTSIIEINGVGKKYNIAHQRGRYVALRDVLANILKSPFRFIKTKAKQVAGLGTKEEFWALKNVSFNVNQGEVIGIIGQNGAGKSTLLKILTGITPPTEGEIIMRGRVASLLEVGTGFHPELTGRENVFLNGAILGMTKKEIARKFDEIVAFAGIEKFLDTPVKYYSSGMYVRLAFSVAAHMEPDILLVDEVLAVGDAEFQKKCLGKMEEVAANSKRTILFVSHNMAAMETLCARSVLLEHGSVKMIGPTKEVIDFYLHRQGEMSKLPLEKRRDRKGSGNVRFTKCELLTLAPKNHSLVLKLSYTNKTEHPYNDAKISVDIKNKQGEHLANITNNVLNQQINIAKGLGEVTLDIKNFNLESGEYSLSLFMASDRVNSEILDTIEDAIIITIDNNGFYTTGKLPPVRSKLLFDFVFHKD